MDHYASETEQIEQIKGWWKENGKSLIFGLVLGVGGLAGYRYWDESKTALAENASTTYEQFLQMAQAQRVDDAKKTGRAIIDNYAGTTYARLSALLLAKIAVDSGEPSEAKALLQPLINDEANAEISYVARARMARILLVEDDANAAAALLQEIPMIDDAGRFNELRGDVLVATGDIDAARTMYLKALAEAESFGLERGAIQLKLDNLATGAADTGS